MKFAVQPTAEKGTRIIHVLLTMATNENEDVSKHVEQFRQIYEPEKHWEARKQFLLNNWGDYPERQLVSLSRVWANMEFDGCEYPAELMERVRVLAAGVEVKECTEVLSSTRNTGKIQQSCHVDLTASLHQPQPSGASGFGVAPQSDPQLQTSGMTGMLQTGRVLAKTAELLSSSFPQLSDQGRKRSREPMDDDMYILKKLGDILDMLLSRPAAVLDQPYNLLNNAAQRTQQKFDIEHFATITEVEEDGEIKKKRDNWIVSVFLKDMKLVTFNGPKGMFKNDCKNAAGNQLINMLLNHRSLTINRQTKTSPGGREYNKELVVVPLAWLQDQPEDYQTKYRRLNEKSNAGSYCGDSDDPLKNFVVLEPSDRIPEAVRDFQGICNSAQANRVSFEVVNSDDKVTLNGEMVWLCKIIINGVLVGFGHDPEQKRAKHHAARVGMEFLRKKCPSVKQKQDHDVDQQSAIPVQDIMHDGNSFQGGSSTTRAIKEDNIGHKMLKTMGWSGEGGLGIGGAGISQPIIPIEHIRREGLGFSESGINKDAVVRIVEDYIASGRQEPLVFSSSLDKVERKEIHSIAHRFNLRSKSHGTGIERYLLVSNKRSLQDVVLDADERGLTGAYEVKIPEASYGNHYY